MKFFCPSLTNSAATGTWSACLAARRRPPPPRGRTATRCPTPPTRAATSPSATNPHSTRSREGPIASAQIRSLMLFPFRLGNFHLVDKMTFGSFDKLVYVTLFPFPYQCHNIRLTLYVVLVQILTDGFAHRTSTRRLRRRRKSTARIWPGSSRSRSGSPSRVRTRISFLI